MDGRDEVAASRRWPRLVLGAVVGSFWLIAVLAIAGGMGVAWVAGWRLEVVTTASMEPEIPVDALAITRPVAPRNVEIGDVIAFREPTAANRRILHRVVEIIEQRGELFFRTQGDNNNAPDPYTLPDDRIEERLLWSVPRLGVLVRVLQPPTSYLVLVGLPLAVGFVGELRRLRRRRSTIDVVTPVTVDRAPAPAPAPTPTTTPTSPRHDRRGAWVVVGAVALGLTLAGQRLPPRRPTRR